MERIGFATQFYTLWDVTSENVYFTDSYGNHHLSGVKTNYHYVKNISTDIEKVKTIYPNVTIDEELRGKTSSFSTEKAEDTTPHIFKFGKHIGKTIEDVLKTDFDYLLWIMENNNSPIKKLIAELPEIKEHYKKIEAKKAERLSSIKVIDSGEVELTFQSNPNHQGGYLPFINNHAYELSELPETLVWEPINDYSDKSKDWFTFAQAKSNTSNDIYKVQQYRETLPDVKKIKQQAEVQELVNKHELNKYYVPTKFAPLTKKYYAVASTGDGSSIFVFFNDIREVKGMYPYNMAIINGTSTKLKGKTIKLNVEVLHTEKYDHHIEQYVIAK